MFFVDFYIEIFITADVKVKSENMTRHKYKTEF